MRPDRIDLKGEAPIKPRKRFRRDDLALTLLSLPTVIWFIAFSYIPLFGIVFAFKHYRYKPGKGMIIANTQGDRPKDGYIGVFSASGHYIVLAAAEGSTVKVWDPMYKEGSDRFDRPGRKGKVRLDGTDAYADFSVIRQDCHERPYFLFWKE